MNIKKIFFFLGIMFFPVVVSATELFSVDNPVKNGINVINVSNVFSDIYEKLNSVNWAGKNINLAIESLEHLNKKAHIAATDDRIVLVWGDELIANYPKPEANNWKDYGQITTALIMKMRENDKSLKSLTEEELYQTVIDALLLGIDEEGRYVSSNDVLGKDGNFILTSIGLDGGRDSRGNFRITGVYKDSSADLSGIRDGDIISEINGKRVSKMTDDEISSVLSGYNSGTSKLKVLTPLGNKYITLRRATVVLADADIIFRNIADDDKGILEIVVHKVSDNAVSIINEALSVHDNISGIVLDLRTSQGFDEKAAAKLAGLFIGQKPVMRVVENYAEEIEIVPGGDAVTDTPVVVLISNTTTGTSEAIAYSFYENKRGVLVGTPSAGKVRISSHINLENGDHLEIMNKSIKTGTGTVIDNRGVFPLVCLSNIRNASQQDAFFVNVLNGDFAARDFNKETTLNVKDVRKSCPVIVSGIDEDNVALGVSIKILTDDNIYNNLMDLL
ncbi:MAG: S41 family peptidase [Alphaproteobacteria bacterium]|nr:S41 family peptidase [Alphaproteobacteria bacterium]